MIQLWHGGSRWIGRPEVQAPKKGRCECGPGIYLTSNYQRARKYAAGNKVTTLVSLADNIRWLEDAKLPLQDLVDFLDNAPRLKGRHSIKEDFLLRCVAREMAMTDPCPVSYLVNVLINTDALVGKVGLFLADWLVAKGIDASLHRPMGQEQWVIVFNPEVICKYQVIPAASVKLDQYDLPPIELPGDAG